MRFDDRLTTLLRTAPSGDAARDALWLQLVDILAQGGADARGADEQGPLIDDAIAVIRRLRADVSLAVRGSIARAISGRALPPVIVALFAEEPAAIAAPLLGTVRLDAEEWIALLPALSPTARGLLRHRRDLPRAVAQALDSFGHSDFALEGGHAVTNVAAMLEPAELAELSEVADQTEPAADDPRTPEPMLLDGESQIRALMARIDAFQSRGSANAIPSFVDIPASVAEPAPDDEGFRFETGPDGVIRWVEGAPRGPLIGESVAVAAQGAEHGVDGYVAGAFRQRAPFRDARLTIAGDSVVAGEWRISAVPLFDHVCGNFGGYRGTARRPRPDEVAFQAAGPALLADDGESDSLRQLVHELRTPLNAIIGFSDMIEGQFLGPAAATYRLRAADISAQGRRLLSAVEDLDMVARYDARRRSGDAALVDAAALLEALHDDYQPVARSRGFRLQFRIARDLGPISGDQIAVERMFARLIAATVGVTQRAERITVSLDHDATIADGIALTVSRPVMLAGRDETMLLDPGYAPDGDWPEAPVLGLGFALRLVRSIATSAGGTLEITSDHLALRLPRGEALAQTGRHGR